MRNRFPLFVLIALLLALTGGFIFLALADVDVQPTPVTRTIPNDRFLNAP